MSYVLALVAVVGSLLIGFILVMGYPTIAWLFEGDSFLQAVNRPWSRGAMMGNIAITVTIGLAAAGYLLYGWYIPYVPSLLYLLLFIVALPVVFFIVRQSERVIMPG